MAEVVAIHIAPGRRLPMKPVESVEAEAGKGLVGDRYHGSRNRQVTLQSTEDVAAAEREFGSAIPLAGTRRNIAIRGMTLPVTPGTRITVGEVELEVYRDTPPCRILDDEIAPGAMKCLTDRAGIACRVITGGTIRVGDSINQQS